MRRIIFRVLKAAALGWLFKRFRGGRGVAR